MFGSPGAWGRGSKFGLRLRRPQNRSRRPSGPPKNSLVTSGGPPVEFLAEISPLQGCPEAPLGSILGAPGVLLALLWARGVENAKISKFANTPHENLDFEGSGGLPGTIFGAKNRSKNKLEAKTARTHVPEPPKSLPERSWRASGVEKKLW